MSWRYRVVEHENRLTFESALNAADEDGWEFLGFAARASVLSALFRKHIPVSNAPSIQEMLADRDVDAG